MILIPCLTLAIALASLKLTKEISWPWWLVLSPLYVAPAVLLIVWALGFAVAGLTLPW